MAAHRKDPIFYRRFGFCEWNKRIDAIPMNIFTICPICGNKLSNSFQVWAMDCETSTTPDEDNFYSTHFRAVLDDSNKIIELFISELDNSLSFHISFVDNVAVVELNNIYHKEVVTLPLISVTVPEDIPKTIDILKQSISFI
jgi:hypothetical protein